MKASDSIRKRAELLEKTLEMSKLQPQYYQHVHLQRRNGTNGRNGGAVGAPEAAETDKDVEEVIIERTSRKSSKVSGGPDDIEHVVDEIMNIHVNPAFDMSDEVTDVDNHRGQRNDHVDEQVCPDNDADEDVEHSAGISQKSTRNGHENVCFDSEGSSISAPPSAVSSSQASCSRGLPADGAVHAAEAQKVAVADLTQTSDSSSLSESLADSQAGSESEGAPKRQEWDRPVEFLLSCIAMSVGLGNVWRFPYTAYKNGGGAFIIPYLVVLLLIGRPLYFMELAIGQFASSNGVKVWNMVPAVRGVGYGQAIATSAVVSYYTSLIALAVYYLVASFSAVLPWVVCDPDIVVPGRKCIDAGQTVPSNLTSLVPISSAEQYFVYNVLRAAPDINDGIGIPDWKLTLCLAACYLMLFLTLWKGVASSGKVAYFTAIFPYVVLFTLLVRGLTLKGSLDGIYYYFNPQWEELLNIRVWYEAVTQSFFSLSVGFGAIISYSSYNGFRHDVYRDAWIISLTDTFTSMLAGATIFSILGNLASELNVPIDEVVKDGTSLAFISYPRAIGQFDFTPQLFAVLFFLMLITLGLGSATGLTSAIISIICDQRPGWNNPRTKTKITFYICLAGFLIGLVYTTPGGQQILTLVDFFGGGFLIFAMTIGEVVAVNWIYGSKRLIRDIDFMLGRKIGIYWRFCWGAFIPVALSLILGYSIYNDFVIRTEPLQYGGVDLPPAAMYAGWALVSVAVAQVLYWFLHAVFIHQGETCLQKFQGCWRPNEAWGPKRIADRKAWVRQEALRHIDQILHF